MLCNSPSLIVNPSFQTFKTTSSWLEDRLEVELRDGITKIKIIKLKHLTR